MTPITSYTSEYKQNMSLDNRPDKEAIYYFAYGSNMDQEQMEKRREEGPERMSLRHIWPAHWDSKPASAIPIGKATLSNYKLCFNKISSIDSTIQYASVVPSEGSNVEGVLYKLDKKFIKVLDFYEGVESDQYTRELVNVTANKAYDCLVYIAHPQATLSPTAEGKPSKQYLDTIITGATNFDLGEETMNFLRNQKTAD
jgi:gamma-glutamylcyclotransferase (GGCT)/AIG2-like uncharacterized protein YtfP